jgi:mRNA interferase RelE/StbE
LTWAIEFDPAALKELRKLDRVTQRRIVDFLHERVAPLGNPRGIGEALRGPVLGKYWKYRVGDYRIICDINDRRITILVVRIGNRREVYR